MCTYTSTYTNTKQMLKQSCVHYVVEKILKYYVLTKFIGLFAAHDLNIQDDRYRAVVVSYRI